MIIRVEHAASGKGIWMHKADDWDVWGHVPELNKRHEDDFPGRRGDFPPDKVDSVNLDDYFCAYKSIDQFREWVKPEEVQILLQHGFNILVLDVRKVVEGSKQMFFKREWVTGTKVINELFI